MDDNETNCYQNLTYVEQYSSFGLSGLCAITLVISIPAVILGLQEYCVKNNLSILRTERLLLYLGCADLVFSFLGCFQWISHFSCKSSVAKVGCSIIGYLWLMIAIFATVITFCIGIHFLVQICKPKLLTVPQDRLIKISKRMETIYLSSAILVSIILSPIPFIKNVFGYNLWICWIITTNTDRSTLLFGSVIATVFYASVLVILIFSSCVMVTVHIKICLRKRNIPNLYVWALSSYIFIFMLVFVATVIIHFIKVVPSPLHGMHILALGMMPLAGSVAILMAVSLKKYFDRQNLHKRPNNYRKYNSVDQNTNRQTTSQTTTDRAPTTFWKPAATDEIPEHDE